MQFAAHIAISPVMPCTQREAGSRRGIRPGGWTMIGCRGYRVGEPPRAWHSRARPAPDAGALPAPSTTISPAPAADDRPAPCVPVPGQPRGPPIPGRIQADTAAGPARGLTDATGPAEAPLAQANQAPKSTTDGSQGMTYHTSAWAHCKSCPGLSTCDIAIVTDVEPPARDSEGGP